MVNKNNFPESKLTYTRGLFCLTNSSQLNFLVLKNVSSPRISVDTKKLYTVHRKHTSFHNLTPFSVISYEPDKNEVVDSKQIWTDERRAKAEDKEVKEEGKTG